MNTTTVKPADLQPGDRIVKLVTPKESFDQRPVLTVVKIDKVDPFYVRFHFTGPNGVVMQSTAHPDHNYVVERPEFDLDEGEPTPKPWANDMRVKGEKVR